MKCGALIIRGRKIMNSFVQINFLIVLMSFLTFGCSSNFTSYSASNSQGSSNLNNPQGNAGPQMQLTWKANAGEQQGFYIEQSLDGVSYSQIKTIPDGVNTTSIGVTRGQRYYFRIRGYNQAGPSPYSAIVMGSL